MAGNRLDEIDTKITKISEAQASKIDDFDDSPKIGGGTKFTDLYQGVKKQIDEKEADNSHDKPLKKKDPLREGIDSSLLQKVEEFKQPSKPAQSSTEKPKTVIQSTKTEEQKAGSTTAKTITQKVETIGKSEKDGKH